MSRGDSRLNSDLTELVERWRLRPPPPATAARIESVLIRTYRAYEIPLSLIPPSDFAGDDEVYEDEVFKLFTITDPEVLTRVYSAEDRERQRGTLALDPEALEEEWRDAFTHPEDLALKVMWLQIRRGQRITILLEGSTSKITSFKVYGSCQELVDVLAAHIGWERASMPHPQRPAWDVVRVGDITDYSFARYLNTVERLNLWGDGEATR